MFRIVLGFVIASFFTITNPARAADPAIAAAIAVPDRPTTDVERDARRKPAQTLEFYGVAPGMRVLEQGAGGGYYTRLLSHIVGPQGKVIAQNRPQIWQRFAAEVEPVYAKLGNVEGYVGDINEYPGADNSLDLIFIVQIWHHMHFDPASGEQLPAATVAFLDQALRWLKPGGVLAIVEHQAAAGANRAQSAAWHRAPRQMTIDDITMHGFELGDSADFLNNPDDDLRNYWREALPERDSSQQFVLKFVKPAR